MNSKVADTSIQKDDEKKITTNPDPESANRSFLSKVPTTEANQTVNYSMSDVISTLESQTFPCHTSVPGDGCRMDFSDVPLTADILHSGKHQLFRRMQNPHPEDVTVLEKRTRGEMIIGEKKENITIWYDAMGEDTEAIDKEDNEVDEPKHLKIQSNTPEWSEMVKDIRAVEELEGAMTSDIEREQVENALNSYHQSIDKDEDREEEERKYDANSLQVPLPQLEYHLTILRSLIKGKKKFQHQVFAIPFFPELSNFCLHISFRT